MRIPFAVNSYQARSLPLSAQRLVNLYPEAQPPDAKMPLALFGTPGSTLFATCGSGPIYGAHMFAGTLCVVSGTNLYTVDSAGVATDRGSVGATSRVAMDDNGAELVIVAGTAAANSYTWDGTTLAVIPDGDFFGASDVSFLDGYMVFTRPSTDQFFISALNNATAYDPTDIATAEGQPDDLVGLVVDHREIWLFGAETIEIWYNSGNADFPMERISGSFIERGCASRDSIAKMDNSVFWLGEDLIVYRAAGYAPERISTHAMEFAVEGYASPSTAEGWTYTQEGHKFYVLTFAEATWVFDASNSLWHECESRDSLGESLGRWRVGSGVFGYNKNLVGDYVNGNIYELDLDVYSENGTTIRRVCTSPPIHGETRRVKMSRFQVEIESGAGLTTGQGSDPQAMLEWSDDGGRTWSNEHWADMGEIGQYKRRVIWRRLGSFRERIFRMSISDPIKVAIIAANADTK